MKYKKKNKGFSLIEMLIYTAIMSFFMIAAVNASLLMTGAYKNSRTSRLLNTAAFSSFQKIGAEVRKSSNIDELGSILDLNPGRLSLDQPLESSFDKVLLYSSGGVLKMDRNSAFLGDITPAGVNVDSLIFHKINSSDRQAVKIEMTLTAEKGGQIKTETFYNTVVLRRSYP